MVYKAVNISEAGFRNHYKYYRTANHWLLTTYTNFFDFSRVHLTFF